MNSNLLSFVERANAVVASSEKIASDNGDVNALIGELGDRMAGNSQVERLTKQAELVGDTAAKSFKASLDTDEFAEKVASLLFEKIAVATSPELIEGVSAPQPVGNPQEQVIASSKQVITPEAAAAQKIKEDLLKKSILTNASVEGSAVNNNNVEKKAAELGCSPEFLNELAAAMVDGE